MNRTKKKLGEQSGGSAVEFALLLVFLCVLLFGIVEFSLVLYNQAVITNASREGARAGIVYTSGPRVSTTDIQAVVNAYCAQYLITAPPMGTPNVTVTPGVDPGDSLTVRVQYHYNFFVLPRLPGGISGWLSGIDLSARTIMRLE